SICFFWVCTVCVSGLGEAWGGGGGGGVGGGGGGGGMRLRADGVNGAHVVADTPWHPALNVRSADKNAQSAVREANAANTIVHLVPKLCLRTQVARPIMAMSY
ncbi:MAG: hypothetical protein LBB74_10000, partial [Chitinispirillales bacterium]|nr:hypothetical protein [Chitinispirillales bacterium]